MSDLINVNRQRIMNLFRMDLRKMLRGKAFYVMLLIAIFIPIMMLTQMPGVDSTMFLGGTDGNTAEAFGGGAMGLTFLWVLTGILLSIYIGSDYSTGFIKNIVTSHANKLDYIISKEMIALVWNASLYIVYIVTLAAAGFAMGCPLQIPSAAGLALYFFELLVSSVAMSSLIIMINLIFRRLYGWSICFGFFIASGIIIMGARMGLESSGLGFIANFLNITIAGSASLAKLQPDAISLLIIVAVSVLWTFVYSMIANKLMNINDVL
ncbi:MAG: ABC transporter permease [Oscillospiraceae bacterium]